MGKLMALATVSRGLASHRMLTMTLAAILCHCDSASTFLEAGKARPGQKGDEGQGRDTGYPEAMSFMLLHDALQILLNSLKVPVNPCCLFSREVGDRVFWLPMLS